MIHKTAIVSDEAELAKDVKIGPYAVIEGGGPDTRQVHESENPRTSGSRDPGGHPAD